MGGGRAAGGAGPDGLVRAPAPSARPTGLGLFGAGGAAGFHLGIVQHLRTLGLGQHLQRLPAKVGEAARLDGFLEAHPRVVGLRLCLDLGNERLGDQGEAEPLLKRDGVLFERCQKRIA